MNKRDKVLAAEQRLRAQGYKSIEELDLTPEQRAFFEGFKKGFEEGWAAAAERYDDLQQQIAGIEATALKPTLN